MATSSNKYFSNIYPDYTMDNAKGLINTNHTIDNLSKISIGLEEKWGETVRQLENYDRKDNTVYTGSAGIALLKLKKEPDNLKNLQECLTILNLNRLENRSVTFLCGDSGPIAIGAIISLKLGKQQEYENLIQKLKLMENVILNTDLPNEYLYGRIGYLYSIIYVNKNLVELQSPPAFDDHFIRRIIEVILLMGHQIAKSGKFNCPLMYNWHDSYYLGAAHGLSGILYLLLQVKELLTASELNMMIKPTIDYLITLRFPSGNYPSSIGRETDKYVQWCHGAPGFVYLFSIAYKVFGDCKYLELAYECCDVVWKRGLLRKGYSLCHGVAGNAYCFLEMYQTTKDLKYLYRAIIFAGWCMDYQKKHEEYQPDRPLSLYEGIVGPMYLLLDIQNPMHAKFPGFTL